MTTVYEVLLANRERVEHALHALNKRAARKGLPLLEWSWGKAQTEWELVPDPDYGWVTRVPLTMVDTRVRYAGWTFVATLQHLDGENVVHACPDETVPPEYRTRGPQCDHCRAARRRLDTYVVRHDDGRSAQVGSTCINDFLGDDSGVRLAARASMLADARAIASDGMEGCGGTRGANVLTLAEFLADVAWFVGHDDWGWVSRTTARETASMATADRAWASLTARGADAVRAEPTDEHRAMADAAEQWAESLTDADVATDKGDYLHNLRAIARTGLVEAKTAGLAASMIVAYQRAVARARAAAERAARPQVNIHLGGIGEKVTFGLPAKVGKRGQPLKGAPTVLSTEPVAIDFVHGVDGRFGYSTMIKARTVDGATIVWYESGVSAITFADVGRRYTLAGKVKRHGEYEGAKQTVLSRVVAEPVDTAQGSAQS